MLSLAERIAQTPTGKVLDLGRETILVEQANPVARSILNPRRPMTIVGEGATIVVKDDPLKRTKLSTFLIEADDLNLLGKVIVHHELGAQHGDQSYEACHALELKAAKRVKCEWIIENAVGNSVYLGRDIRDAGSECADIDLDGLVSINAGRQHLAVECASRVKLANAILDTCGHGHSAVVFEPNGTSDLCEDLLVQDVTLKGNTGFAFSGTGGKGSAGLARVTYQRVHCADVPFSAKITHGPGPAVFDQCSGSSVANHPVIVARAPLDHLYVTGFKQRMGGGADPFDVQGVAHFVHSLAP